MKAGVDYLVTLNRRHFIDDTSVAAKSGLRIGTSGEALAGCESTVDAEGKGRPQ